MITAAGTMKPLPVRPVDRIAKLGMQAPLARTATGVMRPLPLPTPDGRDLASAIQTAAYQRMLANHGHAHAGTSKPLPVVDRT